jgi:hypothetical protein
MSGYYRSFGSNGNTLFPGRTHAEAVEFLSKGRKSKYCRPIAKHAFLVMRDDWSISLVMHETCVVTYHEDSTYTLDHGGWKTSMTAAYINRHTPFNIGSTYSRKFPGWALGWTGEKTPARVQKCRTCNGRGGDVYCAKCAYWESAGYCRVGSSRQACKHGKHRTHYIGKSCDRHQHSEWACDACYRCKGKGVRDYGSERIPILWGPEPVRLAADRTIITLNAKRYAYPLRYYDQGWGDWVPFSMIPERDDIDDLIAS